MRSVNKVIIVGNLTRDPEMRQTPNGQSVTTFGIATNREWITQNGDKKSSAEFHECVSWARLAEICNNYLKKGALVYIEGYLKTRSWETPEGVKKFKTEIVVQDMIMLEKKKDRENGEEDDEYLPTENSENENENENENDKVEDKKEDKEKDEEEDKEEDEKKEETPQTEEKSEENPIDKDLGL